MPKGKGEVSGAGEVCRVGNLVARLFLDGRRETLPSEMGWRMCRIVEKGEGKPSCGTSIFSGRESGSLQGQRGGRDSRSSKQGFILSQRAAESACL